MERTTGTDSPVEGTLEGRGRIAIEPEFYDFEDAAGVLRLSVREIYRLVGDGELVIVQYKRRKLIEPTSVHRLAEKIRSGAFAPAALAVAA